MDLFVFRINVRYVSVIGVCVRIQLVYDGGCILAAAYHILDDRGDIDGGGGGGCLFVDILFHFWIVDGEEHIINEPDGFVGVGGGGGGGVLTFLNWPVLFDFREKGFAMLNER